VQMRLTLVFSDDVLILWGHHVEIIEGVTRRSHFGTYGIEELYVRQFSCRDTVLVTISRYLSTKVGVKSIPKLGAIECFIY
jgi:hypothetical protein